jgi:hypothetical protein
MKKVKEVSTKFRVTKSDNDPVKRGDNITLTRKVKSRGPGPDVVEPPKPPRKSLDERIAEAIVKTVPNLINQALKPVVSRLDNIDTRLDKQDEFNQYVRNVFERNNLR